MPKKKTPKNAFYFFMLDLQEQQYVKQGLKKPSMSEMVAIASPKWNNLPLNERERYNEKAKNAKGQDKITLQGKLTSDGKPILQIQAEMEENIQKINEMKQNVRELVLNLGEMEDVAEADFIIMSFNILCATDDGTFIPNEIGIVKFNLNEGIKETFHKFIDPGQIPFGYTGDAKAHSEATHQIPIHSNDFDAFDQNYSGIYREIQRFCGVRRGQSIFVFCLPEHLEQNESCLSWLHTKAWTEEQQWIFFADITYLLLELASFADRPIASESLANDVLNQHSFDYSANTRCKFHDEIDNAHCALSYPQRLSYILCDTLCPMYNITVTEQHLPLRLNRNVLVETWQPKGPIKPVVNRVDVPFKPVAEHQTTMLTHNARSIFTDCEKMIIPSAMTQNNVRTPEPEDEIPDVDDDEEFPSLSQTLRNTKLQDNIRCEPSTLRQPYSMPLTGIGRGNAWARNIGRGSTIFSEPNSSVDSCVRRGIVAGGPSLLGAGLGRGLLRKPNSTQ